MLKISFWPSAALVLIPLTSLLFLCAFQSKQDPYAEQILNLVSKKYKKFKGFSATYKHETESNSGEKMGEQSGSILVSGSSYVLTLPETKLICDGKIVWSINAKNKEVNISDYEPEPDDITPERVYSFYQRGYKYIFMGEVKTPKGIWQTIDLEPENITKEVAKIRLFVDKQSHQITKWIVFERGTNNRESFLIQSFKTLNQVSPADFRFDKSKYPGYKVIDLR